MTSNRVMEIRQSLGETQQEFAGRLGVCIASISKWERGIVAPSRMAVEKLLIAEKRSKLMSATQGVDDTK